MFISFAVYAHHVVEQKFGEKEQTKSNTSPVTAVTAIKSIFGDHIIKSITNDECFSSVCRNDVAPGIFVVSNCGSYMYDSNCIQHTKWYLETNSDLHNH